MLRARGRPRGVDRARREPRLGLRAGQSSSGDLALTFVDWQEQPRRAAFADVLAFRWQEFDERDIRDDVVYEVTDSEWLARQAKLQAVEAEGYVHFKLCFNACGTLNVLCRRVGEAR